MKPKLLHFRPPESLLPINNIHPLVTKLAKALSYYFNVQVVDFSCDYNDVLDRYQPDLVMFELWQRTFDSYKVSGAKGNKSIPKIGYMAIDSCSPSRGGYYFAVEDYEVDAIFAIDTQMGEAFPEINDILFYYPPFIDSDINKDYALLKTIPVLLTGMFDDRAYPWRYEVKRQLLVNFPSLYFRHPGYSIDNKISEFLRIEGEKYFKTINSSWIVPTCGSYKKLVLLKHLEIPGSRACLITEESTLVGVFGFKDMENCIFSSPDQITEKINYLFNNPILLNTIIENGYRHVHNNHTYKHRPQIYQWYNLFKNKTPYQKIIQKEILGDLELVEKNSELQTEHLHVSLDVKLVTKIDDLILQGDYKQAKRLCREASQYLGFMAEPKIRLCLINLLQNRPKEAYAWLTKILVFETGFAKAPTIDPINMALFILSSIFLNRKDLALEYSRMEFSRRRDELDYVRLLAFKIYNESKMFNTLINELQNKTTVETKKTLYYFYADGFNAISIFEKIIKNIWPLSLKPSYRFINLRNSKVYNNEVGSIYDYELTFNREKFIQDYQSMYKPPLIPRIKRKFNKLRVMGSKYLANNFNKYYQVDDHQG